jgi:hypothetical protein
MRIELLENGVVVNTIEASEEFAEQHYLGAWRLAAEQNTPDAGPSLPRHITVGAFYDRFGAAKWNILADTDASVQAVIKDSSVRKYIDLDNPDLPAGLAIIQAAGHDIDPDAILGDPIEDKERP